MQQASVAIEAGQHVQKALATIVDLLQSRRDSVRLQAAVKLLDLASGAAEELERADRVVYVLQPSGSESVSDVLRSRRMQ